MLERDKILLERIIADDDPKAFEYLYHYYSPALCNYAMGFVNRFEDARDLVNDCFFEFWKGRKTLKVNTSLKAWLFITVRNKAINHLKHERSARQYISETSYPFSFQEEVIEATERLLQQDNLEENLKKALEQLPDQCRYIFFLNRFEGLRYKEIAKKLNLSPATVKTQVARALKRLRGEMENMRSIILYFLNFFPKNL